MTTQAQKDIEQEIEWYEPRWPIAKAMRELGEIGFEFSGHGVGFGGEDFNLSRESDYYVNFCDKGKGNGIVATVYPYPDDDVEDEVLFSGSANQAVLFIKDT